MRSLFKEVKKKIAKHRNANSFWAIAETLYPKSRHISFKQFNSSKAAKCGLLNWFLCDATVNYAYWTFFFIAANFRLFLLKKMKFRGNFHKFCYFGEKNYTRSHLPNLSKLRHFYLKNMSKFRANNHFWFVLIFYSRLKKKKNPEDFCHFCYKCYRELIGFEHFC